MNDGVEFQAKHDDLDEVIVFELNPVGVDDEGTDEEYWSGDLHYGNNAYIAFIEAHDIAEFVEKVAEEIEIYLRETLEWDVDRIRYQVAVLLADDLRGKLKNI